MAKLYRYVGPDCIHSTAAKALPGMRIDSSRNLLNWLRATNQEQNREGLFVVTFVVDQLEALRVSERRSEHINCSGGTPVLSAGEMFFNVADQTIEVVDVTNHSTGFCPEPESWPVVAAALDRLGIQHPGRFTGLVFYRLCSACGQRNIVKDGWLVCGTCGASLPSSWNF